jgi:hypothetical protein
VCVRAANERSKHCPTAEAILSFVLSRCESFVSVLCAPLGGPGAELACRFHKPHRGGSCDFAQPTAVRVVALQSKLSSFLCFWRKPPSTFQPHLSKARELESWPVLVMRLTPVPHCLAHTRGTKAGVVKHAFAGGGGRVQIGGSGCRGCEGLI